MKIIDTPISDLKIIEPRVFGDERGFFMETWKEQMFREAGIIVDFVQDNHSTSNRWVLRGLHFQTKKPQAKLVRVVSGAVYDVAVDCRKWSPSYGKRFGLVLSAENKKQLFVPEGFAHGFLTLEDNTEFLYKVSDVYDPHGEWWVMWNDPALAIDWQTYMDEYGIHEVQLSKKDTLYESFEQLPVFFWYETFKHSIYVYIDTQNVWQTFMCHGWKIDWKRLYVYLRDKYKVRKVMMFLWYLKKKEKFYAQLKKWWYELHFKSTRTIKWKVKWNVDAELVLQAMKEKDRLWQAILMTSDGDFACLAHELLTEKKLHSICTPHVDYCSSLLKDTCIEYIEDLFKHRTKFATKIEQ